MYYEENMSKQVKTKKGANKKIKDMYNKFFADCKNNNRCQQICLMNKYKYGFLYDRAMQYSKSYFKSKVKVMVVGMESRGIMHAGNDYEYETLDPGKNMHWKATALEIIKAIYGYDKKKMNELEGNFELRKKECKNCGYAFTDFYKCAFSKNGKFSNDLRRQNNMKANCTLLFKQEIELMKPNLIIFQGINGKESIDNVFNAKGKQLHIVRKSKKRFGLWEYKNKHSKVYVIVTPFPQNRYNNGFKWNETKNKTYEMIEMARNKII